MFTFILLCYLAFVGYIGYLAHKVSTFSTVPPVSSDSGIVQRVQKTLRKGGMVGIYEPTKVDVPCVRAIARVLSFGVIHQTMRFKAFVH